MKNILMVMQSNKRFIKKYFKIILLIFICTLIFIETSNITFNIFIYSIAIIPLAVLLGEFTSTLSLYLGEKKGGLLAATLGNIPELIMGVWSIRYGMIAMAKAALIGSIINNMLLVLGISIFLGGVKYSEQSFNKNIARTNFNMLLLAMASMIIMRCIERYGDLENNTLISISMKVSLVLVGVYIMGLIFSLYTHRNLFVISEEGSDSNNKDTKQVVKLFIWLIGITVILYFFSEKLIFNIKSYVEYRNVSQSFIGIMLVPLLGNIGENISAILCALKNKVNLSLEIAIGSSIQISLFASPLIIIVALFMKANMTFIFSTLQIVVSALAVGMSFIVFADGKTYWLEGVILIAVYIIITICYFYVS